MAGKARKADNLYTAYMDYLRLLYDRPAAPTITQGMTADQRAALDKAIADAVTEYRRGAAAE